MKSRQDKGEGKDMGGEDLHSRYEAIENARIAAKKAANPRRGAEPMEDPGATGSKVANAAHAPHAGFKVYTEKEGGRAGMKGKRRG